MTMPYIKSPIPYAGGKSSVMPDIYSRLGDTPNFIDPFCGSLSSILGRPESPNRTETVNDLNGWLTNAYRSIQFAPDEVAHHADWPVSELDLHARGNRLFFGDYARNLVDQVRADPDYYDAKAAGWYIWGMSSWIGPYDAKTFENAERMSGQRPILSNRGAGVNRVKYQIPFLSRNGMGVNSENRGDLYYYMRAISARLRRVRIICGDWRRVLTPSVTTHNGITSVLLDPPYLHESGGKKRDGGLYGARDDANLAHDVREWALENGDNPMFRIAMCGYVEEHDRHIPEIWERFRWTANRGMAAQGNENRKRECVWFSPHCVRPGLF